MPERRSLRVVARDRRQVDVAGAVLFVPHMTLVFENPEERANGRIARRFPQLALDFGCRGLAALIEDVENLPLPAAQIPMVVPVHTDP